MEGLERLVSQSFARHQVETSFDHRRLQWSPWFRCVDSLSLVRLSSKPGLFALADEVAPRETGGKPTLALLRISEAEDLGLALGRLVLSRSPECGASCFARYAVVEDAAQRRAAHDALQAETTTENREPGTEICSSN